MDWKRGRDKGGPGTQAEDESAGRPVVAQAAGGGSLSAPLGPSSENRDLRQLIWHRHRLVQMRTRAMNQLQAAAMNEGVRRKRNCGARLDEGNWRHSRLLRGPHGA